MNEISTTDEETCGQSSFSSASHLIQFSFVPSFLFFCFCILLFSLNFFYFIFTPLFSVLWYSYLTITAAKLDLQKFESVIDKLYRTMDCEAIRFERAVRTQV